MATMRCHPSLPLSLRPCACFCACFWFVVPEPLIALFVCDPSKRVACSARVLKHDDQPHDDNQVLMAIGTANKVRCSNLKC